MASEEWAIFVHLIPGVIAGLSAWVAVRYEIRHLKKITGWVVGRVVSLVEIHNKLHPDAPISLGGLGDAMFTREKDPFA